MYPESCGGHARVCAADVLQSLLLHRTVLCEADISDRTGSYTIFLHSSGSFKGTYTRYSLIFDPLPPFKLSYVLEIPPSPNPTYF